MQKLILAILLVLCCGTAWGATYYVRTDGNSDRCTGLVDAPDTGSGTSQPCSWGDAGTTKALAKIGAFAGFLDGDIIKLKRGNTFSNDYLRNSHNNITFTSYGDTSSTLPIVDGGTATYSARFLGNNQTFNGIWFKGKPLYTYNKTGNIIKNCVFSELASGTASVELAGASDGLVYNVTNSLFLPPTPSANTIAIQNTGGSTCTVNVNNSEFYGTYLYAFGGGVINHSNNVYWGKTWNAGESPDYCVKNGVSVCNNLGNNIEGTDPKHKTNRFQRPKVAWSHDDAGNLPHFFSVLDGNPEITKATFNLYLSYDLTQSADALCQASYGVTCKQKLNTLVDSGRAEIANHTWFHNNLNMDNAFTIDVDTTKNPNPQIVISDHHIALTSDNVSTNITLDWSGDWYTNRKTQTQLRTAMNCTTPVYQACYGASTTSGWGMPTSNLAEGLWLSSMKSEAGSTTFPYQVKTDRGPSSWRYYEDEIGRAQETLLSSSWLDSSNHPNRKITAFAYPNGVSDSVTWNYFANVSPVSFKGARGTSSGGTAGAYVESVNVYSTLGIPAYAFRGTGSTNNSSAICTGSGTPNACCTGVGTGTDCPGDEDAVRKAARSMYGWAQMRGGFLTTYIHGNSDLSVQQTQWIIDEWTNMGVDFVTYSELLDFIKSDHTTSDNITYTKTYPHGDYRLQDSSPLINSGSNTPWTGVASATDPDGHPITDSGGNVIPRRIGGVLKPNVDIGAYQYHETLGIGFTKGTKKSGFLIPLPL